jgi:hypothetical protein
VNLAYRRVAQEDSTRPVSLIVLCDLCGNREVGYAWHDGGQVLLWTPKPLLAFYGLRGGDRVAKPGVWNAQSRPQMRCPRHGDLRALEAVDPADLSPASTRRIRARKFRDVGSTA